MLIHKEGKKMLTIVLLILILINIPLLVFLPTKILTYLVFVISVILLCLLLNFFKKPKRIYKGKLNGIVCAPTDGKVVVIEKVFEDQHLHTECIQISIFMTIFNAHSNWLPVTGKVVHYSHDSGNFHAAYLPKSSHENERSTIIIETYDGHKILTRQIAGACARRIVTYIKEGESYNIGSPLGFIKFGSRVDVFLPTDCEILVQKGDNVQSNVSILAVLPQLQKLTNI